MGLNIIDEIGWRIFAWRTKFGEIGVSDPESFAKITKIFPENKVQNNYLKKTGIFENAGHF